MSAEATAVGLEPPADRRGYRWYVLIVLMTVFAFSHMDRNIIAILLNTIREDLGLSNKQAGAVSGLAFGITYIGLSIPIARLADRVNRTSIITVCLAIWSGMTAVCGLVTNYWQLFFARMGVGVGEAGGVPPSQSIIADYFPKRRRALAFSIFGLGIPIGTLLGFGLGGALNEAYSWQVAFFAVGIPGLLLAALLKLTVREPLRGYSDQLTAQDPEDRPDFAEVLRFLGSRKSLIQMTIASSLIVFGGYGSQIWLPSFFERSHGMTSAHVGYWFGPALLLGGLGAVLLGSLADRLGEHDERWYMRVPALAILIAFPLSAIILLIPATHYTFLGYSVPSYAFCFLLMALPGAAYACYIGPVTAMLQQMVGLRMRATTIAVFLLITNVVGLGIGPVLIGAVTDIFEDRFGQEALRYAMLSFLFIYVWSSIHFFMAARTIREDLEALRS